MSLYLDRHYNVIVTGWTSSLISNEDFLFPFL